MTERSMTVRCPALAELFAEEPTTALADHIASCRRCQSLLASNDERLALEATSASVGQSQTDAELAAAVVHLVFSTATDEYLPAVVAKVADETVTVVPVSGQVELAAEWDMLLEADVLGYRAMAEAWNFGSVLPEQVGEPLATLRPESFELLRGLVRAAATGGDQPAGVPVGPPIIGDEDPRLLFREEEGERVHAFWEPALALAGAANLAQLVAHRREELALTREELEPVSLAEHGWLERLERGELPIQRYLLPGALAALMSRLQIGASRRLARIATWTLEEQAQSSDLASGAALARRRVGTSSSSGQSVAEYVDEFMRELERQERG